MLHKYIAGVHDFFNKGRLQVLQKWLQLGLKGNHHVLQSDIHFFLPADPVPGACNMEFDLDIDPNVYLHYNLFETIITFAPANIGYVR